jgi:hypothetical protein
MVRQNLVVSAHAARDFPEMLVLTGSVHTEVQSWKLAQYIRGPTRLETVSRHPTSHASSIIASVLLCASVFQTPSLLGGQTRLVNTEAQR